MPHFYLLSTLAMLFKAWMTIDALLRCRGQTCGNSWFMITLLPFGDVAYFWMVKRHDPEIKRFFALLSYHKPKIDQFEHAYETCKSQVNRIRYAKALVDSKQFEAALKILQEAKTVDATDKEIDFLIGFVLCHTKKFEESLSVLSPIIEKDFLFLQGEVVRIMIDSYAELKQWENAEQLSRKLVKFQDRIDTRLLLAKVLCDSNKSSEAAEILQFAIKDYKSSPPYIRSLYRGAYRECGRMVKMLHSKK